MRLIGVYLDIKVRKFLRYRLADSQTRRLTDSQTHRLADSQTDRQTHISVDSHFGVQKVRIAHRKKISSIEEHQIRILDTNIWSIYTCFLLLVSGIFHALLLPTLIGRHKDALVTFGRGSHKGIKSSPNVDFRVIRTHLTCCDQVF